MTDIEIAQQCKIQNIEQICQKVGLTRDDYDFYGKYNYYVENSHTPNGIGKLYSSAEDVYSDGGNLFTEKTQRDNILNNEIYKEIISLFETAN